MRVYAGTRGTFTHRDKRVIRLELDVTNPEQVREASRTVTTLDVLVNNAGIALYDDLSDLSVMERHLAVNLFGPYNVTKAFLPHLIRSKGVIINNISLNALAPLPVMPSYAISKAAAYSMTQSMRAHLAGRGVKVYAALTGPTDTDMTRGLNIPKNTPANTARGIFDGVERGEEEVFPDPLSATVADRWRSSPAKDLESQLASFVPPTVSVGQGEKGS